MKISYKEQLKNRNLTEVIKMGEEWIKQEGAGIWLPKEKDAELKGEVIRINTEGLYGVQYLIQDTDGAEWLTPSHKVLQNRMQKVKEGENVKIVYVGQEPPKVRGQNPTEMYEVFIKD